MKFKQKFLSAILSTGLVVGSTFVCNANPQQLEVHHINVGQGESIYIELPDGSDVLIDAGKSDYGKSVVNYLKNQEKDIDIEYLIATHPDEDHIGGMQEVFKDLKVKNFIYPKDAQNNSNTWNNVLNLANLEGCKIQDSTPGTNFNIGGANMKFIQPNKDYPTTNEDSVVTYLNYNNIKFLFTGDIEAPTENDMVKEKLVPKVDFISVPHHGSKGSSTQAFLNEAKPKYAVISVGKGNKYGHPTEEALKRYHSIGSKVYRTDQNGDIVIKTDGYNSDINYNSSIKKINDIDTHWAASYINAFIDKCYINGYEDGTFKPEKSITRAEFVTIFNKIFGLTNDKGIIFNDTQNHWAKNNISIAVSNGVCNGISSNAFEPDKPITREQAAKMISNYKKISDTYHNKLNSYNDSWAVSSWAKDAVESILEAGYMKGNDNIFRPSENITRAEAVVTLSRVLSNPNPVMPQPPVIIPSNPIPQPPVVTTVYINGGSSSSNKYHKSSYSHGMKEAVPMNRSEADKKGYIPCHSCFK